MKARSRRRALAHSGSMVEVLAGGDPRQQAGGGHAAIDDGRRDRRGRLRLARTARVLGTDMAMHEETRRLHVQLLADVLADLDQVGAAPAALARFGLVAMLDARQFSWQWLAADALALALGGASLCTVGCAAEAGGAALE